MSFFHVFDSDSLNKRINTTNNMIAIKCVPNCDCYTSKRRNIIYYYCIKPVDSDPITYRDIINILVEEKYTPGCDHMHLIDFKVSKNKAEVIPLFSYVDPLRAQMP